MTIEEFQKHVAAIGANEDMATHPAVLALIAHAAAMRAEIADFIRIWTAEQTEHPAPRVAEAVARLRRTRNPQTP